MLEFHIDWCRKSLVLKWESGWFEDSQGQEYESDVVRAGSLNYVVIYEGKSPIKKTSRPLSLAEYKKYAPLFIISLVILYHKSLSLL